MELELKYNIDQLDESLENLQDFLIELSKNVDEY